MCIIQLSRVRSCYNAGKDIQTESSTLIRKRCNCQSRGLDFILQTAPVETKC